jgi:hypothetical protein
VIVELVRGRFVDLSQLDVTNYVVGATVTDVTDGGRYRLDESSATVDHSSVESVADQPSLRWIVQPSPVTSLAFGIAAGVAEDGPVTLADALVGDVVAGVTNLTDRTDARASFESTVTVGGEVQQTEDADLSTKTFQFILARAS